EPTATAPGVARSEITRRDGYASNARSTRLGKDPNATRTCGRSAWSWRIASSSVVAPGASPPSAETVARFSSASAVGSSATHRTFRARHTSEPLALAEAQVQQVRGHAHQRERERVPERPVELGHVAEGHPVEAGDQGGDQDDRGPRRELLPHGGLPV